MARYITVESEAKRLKKKARQFGESCEYVVGTAIHDYIDDFTGESIKEGDECAYLEMYPNLVILQEYLILRAKSFIKIN